MTSTMVSPSYSDTSARTLMSHFLRDDESQLAMKSDFNDLRSEITALRSDIAGLMTNLITGLIVIVAAMIGILFAVL